MGRRDQHKLVLLGISVFVLIISVINSSLLYRSAKNGLWNNRLASGNREVREIGRLLETQLQSGLSKEQVIDNLQQSIVNTDIGSEFVCMYNTSGIELCHPNPALIGKTIDSNDSEITLNGDGTTLPFSELLSIGKFKGGIRTFSSDSDRGSEIINVYPVKGTDWMVASHASIPALQKEVSELYLNFVLGFLVSSLLIISVSYVLVRLAYQKYEKRTADEIHGLNEEISALNTLNHRLAFSKEQLETRLHAVDVDQETTKRRLLAYRKDEIISLDTDGLAFIFLKNGLPLTRTLSNLDYPINGSLDELIKQLDGHSFFRANRQFIVNIQAIKTIQIYGKNQLKLITDPPFDNEVIISKNKVAEFKKWLDR